MGKIPAPKRIRLEDYSADDRPLVNSLSQTLNTFLESVYQVLNGNLDFDNLAQSIVNVQVSRNSDATTLGTLKNPITARTNLTRKIIGVICINSTNLISSGIVPESQPGVTFTINGVGNITIQKVTGLQPNSKYNLTLQLIT